MIVVVLENQNCRRCCELLARIALHYDSGGDKQLAFVFSFSFRSVLLTRMPYNEQAHEEWSDKIMHGTHNDT